MDISAFKTCKMIKIEFNKQMTGRYDSKTDFHDYIQSIIEKLDNLCYTKNVKEGMYDVNCCSGKIGNNSG